MTNLAEMGVALDKADGVVNDRSRTASPVTTPQYANTPHVLGTPGLVVGMTGSSGYGSQRTKT